MKLDAAQKAALIRALHSTEGAASRWDENRRIDDESLKRRIANEFGISGGYYGNGVWVDYHGGVNPRIEIRVGADTPVELAGRALLAAVREVLGLARSGELF